MHHCTLTHILHTLARNLSPIWGEFSIHADKKRAYAMISQKLLPATPRRVETPEPPRLILRLRTALEVRTRGKHRAYCERLGGTRLDAFAAQHAIAGRHAITPAPLWRDRGLLGVAQALRLARIAPHAFVVVDLHAHKAHGSHRLIEADQRAESTTPDAMRPEKLGDHDGDESPYP